VYQLHNNHHIKRQQPADFHKMTLKKDTKTNKAKLQKKRAELVAKGINLRAHCATNNIDYQAARDLLCGKCKGRRGKAHDAAVFLGLKPNPEQIAV
jgi:gp16 family phage-associated protein